MSRQALVFQVFLLVGMIVLDSGCEIDSPPFPDTTDSGAGSDAEANADLDGGSDAGSDAEAEAGPVSNPNGSSCKSSSDCVSGFCVDGICCDQSACTPIDSCHVATCSSGSCTDVPRNCPHGGTCANGLCPGQCPGFLGVSQVPLIRNSNYLAKGGGLGPVVAGDVDGDGKPDLVRSSYAINGADYQGRIGVYRNNDDGTFASIPNSINGGYAFDIIGLADMNNDGALDIVETAYNTGTIYTSLYLNDGQGIFTLSHTGLGKLGKLVFVDLNNDGFPEVLVRPDDSNFPLVTLNNTGAALGAPVSTGITGTSDFDAVDLNADGNADLVLVFSTTGNAEVRFGNGDGSFGAPVTYASLVGVNAVALRDLDADGDFDLVASNATNTEVRVNIGGGTFAAALTYSGGSTDIADINGDGYPDILGSTTLFNLGNGTFAEQTMAYMPHKDATFADFNGDGLMDIARNDSPEGTSILHNLGNGLFMKPYVYYGLEFGNRRQFLSVDLNGDNLEDWVIATATNTIAVWINLGSGSFAPQVEYAPGFASTALAAADMNSDGRVDLVTSGAMNDAVLFNVGGGVFGPAVIYPAGNMQNPCSATSDFNGDGHPDVARISSTPANTELTVRFNQGNGTLGPSVALATLPPNPFGLVASDLNGDGHADLLAHGSAENIDVIMNDGMGGFVLQAQPLLSSNFNSFVVADFNADSYPDILGVALDFAGLGSTTMTIYLNNGDGTFHAGSTKDWAGGFGAVTTAVDVDNNGYLDVIFNRVGQIGVFLNDGVSLGPETRYQTISGAVLATDIDGDGMPELLTSKGALHKVNCIP